MSRRPTGNARTTAARPSMWSTSAWVATTNGSVPTPRARRAGTTVCLPTSKSENGVPPPSTSTACPRAKRITTASPWPTSRAMMSGGGQAGGTTTVTMPATQATSHARHGRQAPRKPATSATPATA